MRKSIAIVLVIVFVLGFTSCGGDQINDDTVSCGNNSTPTASVFSEYSGTAVSDNNILDAWTGEFSKEKYVESIKEYQKNYSNIVINAEKEDRTHISFETDFEVSSCYVDSLSYVDNNDFNVELNSYISLLVETKCNDKTVTVFTDWWHDESDSWVNDHMIWAYLVCAKDMSGNNHYFYFRVDYSNMAVTQK